MYENQVQEIMEFIGKNRTLGYRSHSKFIINALIKDIEQYISLKKEYKEISHWNVND